MTSDDALRGRGAGLLRCPLFLVILLCAAVRCHASEPDYAVVVSPTQVGADDAVRRYLTAGDENAEIILCETLEEAASSGADVLVLLLPRRRAKASEELLDQLKKKKVVGIGYGAAQVFGELELEINGDACAHFGAMPNLLMRESILLGERWKTREVTVNRAPTSGDHFGMYIPKLSDKTYVVDVIARAKSKENYAPIVCQGNYVMMGISIDPTTWSDPMRDLFLDVAKTMRAQELKPFMKPAYPLLAPGQHAFRLGKGRSTDELFGKTFYFKFDRPTLFSATLQHADSQNMMMLFMGQRERIHWTREDAKNGELMRIECNITQQDLERIGDNYWTLKVTNFDPGNPAACLLNVQYDGGL